MTRSTEQEMLVPVMPVPVLQLLGCRRAPQLTWHSHLAQVWQLKRPWTAHEDEQQLRSRQ